MSLTGTLVRASGHSWWEVRYLGGKTIGEWQTASAPSWLEIPTKGLQARSRWEQLDHGRIVGARLLCPDGSVGEIAASRPYSIFQFKCGSAGSGTGHSTWAHILGVVTDDEGGCKCYAFEPGAGLVQFTDSVLKFSRYQLGPLNLEPLGVRL